MFSLVQFVQDILYSRTVVELCACMAGCVSSWTSPYAASKEWFCVWTVILRLLPTCTERELSQLRGTHMASAHDTIVQYKAIWQNFIYAVFLSTTLYSPNIIIIIVMKSRIIQPTKVQWNHISSISLVTTCRYLRSAIRNLISLSWHHMVPVCNG